MKFSVDEIIEATNGEIIFNKCNFGKIGICTDSRTIKEDQIFLPLSGENFDGHEFINAALKQGCIGYFIDKEHYNKAQTYYNPTKLIILVENTQEAYLKLSNFIKKK